MRASPPAAARAARLLVASVVLAAAARAGAWARTTGDECGACLYWAPLHAGSGVPWEEVGYLVNGAPRSPGCAGDAGLAAVRASFETWSEVSCSSLRIAYRGATDDGRVGLDGKNVVLFRTGPCLARISGSDPCWNDLSCGSEYGCWDGLPNAYATTLVTYNPVGGFIYDADIEVNDWGGASGALPQPGPTGVLPSDPVDGWYFTCDPPPGGSVVPPLCAAYGDTGCAYADLQNTLTHEAGHVVGLAHPSGPITATMWDTAGVGEISKRDLDPDDVAGICAIYPAGGQPTTCPGTGGPGCEPAGCACRTGGGAGALAAIAVLLALRPRRRRP